MKYKTIFKINAVISIAISLFITIKGSLSRGYLACMGLKEVTQCGISQMLIQVAVFFIIAFVALTLIIGGIKLLFKKRKPKAVKEERIEIKEKPKKEKEEIIKI